MQSTLCAATRDERHPATAMLWAYVESLDDEDDRKLLLINTASLLDEDLLAWDREAETNG